MSNLCLLFFLHTHVRATNFQVQFGISYSKDKELQSLARKQIKDDPKYEPHIPFEPGTISYAGSGPNSRNSQLFISYGSAASLGTQLWETPIGKVISGLNHAEEFYSYGDMPRKYLLQIEIIKELKIQITYRTERKEITKQAKKLASIIIHFSPFLYLYLGFF